MADFVGRLLQEMIDKAVAAAENRTRGRHHFGMSEAGTPCARAAFYSWRWADQPQFEGRMLRLFARGHAEEAKMLANLARVGVEVSLVDPATGKQWVAFDFKGFLGGSCDGRIPALPHLQLGLDVETLFECKTHNTKSFVNLVNNGGVLKNKPVHYDQVQLYMHYFKITQALYCAINKNDDALYFELIPYNEARALELVARANRIVHATTPPARFRQQATAFECKMCDFHGVCWRDKPVRKSCRTCVHVTPVDGEWRCAKFGQAVPQEFTEHGCDGWEPAF